MIGKTANKLEARIAFQLQFPPPKKQSAYKSATAAAEQAIICPSYERKSR
jgi:hypothetical protein